jgi:hypothetical protein
MAGLNSERLREVLNYAPETGVFTWAKKTCRKVTVGKVAGCISKFARGGPYRVIRVDKTLHLAHRLAWLHVHGDWPADELDHINLDGLDNRIDNLRPATRAQNQRNVGISKRNTSGAKGVCKDRRTGKWRARVYAGREYHIGVFDSFEEAVGAHERAAARYHKEFAAAGA